MGFLIFHQFVWDDASVPIQLLASQKRSNFAYSCKLSGWPFRMRSAFTLFNISGLGHEFMMMHKLSASLCHRLTNEGYGHTVRCKAITGREKYHLYTLFYTHATAICSATAGLNWQGCCGLEVPVASTDASRWSKVSEMPSMGWWVWHKILWDINSVELAVGYSHLNTGMQDTYV